MDSALHTLKQITNLALTIFNPAFRRAESKVRNGDMSVALFSPEKLPTQFRNNPDGLYSLRFGTDIGHKNFLLCRPFLIAMADGNWNQAARDYANNRSIHYSHLPEWGQLAIKEIVLQRFNSFDPLLPRLNPQLSKKLKSASPEERALLEKHIQRIRDTSYEDAGKAYVQELGLMSFATLPQFQEFIRSADKLLFSDLLIRSRFDQQISYFSVGNDGPLGILALKTLKELVPLVFSIQIINDCMHILGLQPADQDLINWAKAHSNKAIDFPRSVGLKNLVKLKNFLDTNHIKPEEQEFKAIISEAFGSKNFESFLARRFPEYSQKAQESLSSRDKGSELRKSLVEAINIFCNFKKPAEIKLWATKLVKAIIRTGISYSQVIEDLQQGLSPEQIYNQAFFDILNRNKIQPVLKNTANTENLSESDSVARPRIKTLVRGYKIKLHFDPKELKYEFGHNAASTINTAITRMRKGHFGDIKSLGDSLLENRIHQLAGYRIYFTIKGDCLHILKIGTKSNQQEADIRSSRIMARAIKDSVQ